MAFTSTFYQFGSELKSLYLHNEVTVVERISSLEFLRDFVGPGYPVLVKDAIKDWPAVEYWKMQYFKEALGNKEVTVAVTPYGYGDTIATRHYVSDKVLKSKEYFVLPEERIMRMDTFVDVLQKRLKRPGVFYLQPQRSIIAEKFEELLPDIAPDISWASEAFNAKPQKICLCISDELAATPMHNDFYENIFCVVSGHKDFILHPPTDIPWIPYKKYPVGKYKETTPGTFDILPHKLWACRNFEEEHLYNTTQTWNKYKSYSSQSNSDRSISMMDKSVDGFLHYLNNLDVEDDFKNKTRILVDSYLKSIEVKPSDTNFAPSGCCDIRADELSDLHNGPLGLDNSINEAQGSSVSPVASNVALEEEDEHTISWISINPANPDFETYPQYRNATQIRLRVKTGDLLYLPALWYHHIRQSHACIAVNYVYEMKFDFKYAYFKMLEYLAKSDLN